jgi:hypothetical protein
VTILKVEVCVSAQYHRKKKEPPKWRISVYYNLRKFDIHKEGRQTLRCEIKEFM